MTARRLAAVQTIMATQRLATAMVPLAMLLTLRARHTLSLASFALALWTLACAAPQPPSAWIARGTS